MTILGAQAFNDAIDASLSSYTKANGDFLIDSEKVALREHLHSSNFEAAMDSSLSTNRALVDGDRPVYAFWSGGTQSLAEDYVKEMRISGLDSGTIGDTKWGIFVEDKDGDKGGAVLKNQIGSLNDNSDAREARKVA